MILHSNINLLLMKNIEFIYYVTFGRGDSSDDLSWEIEISDELYDVIVNAIKAQYNEDTTSKKEYDYELLSQTDTLKELATSVYNDIVKSETDNFLENEDPEDWGIEEDVENPDWKIDDTYDLTVRSFRLLDL